MISAATEATRRRTSSSSWRQNPHHHACAFTAVPNFYSSALAFGNTTSLSTSCRRPLSSIAPWVIFTKRRAAFHEHACPVRPIRASAVEDTARPAPGRESVKKASFIKVQRRIAVGFIMGAVVIAFVFSSRWIFATGMLITSLIGLFEYYRMVIAKGHLPARKMGLCVTTATMLSSAFAPMLADVAFPLGGTMICIYLLFRRSKIATIADISTTFMGLFYAGYLPSYWVRLHQFSPASSTQNLIANAIMKIWPGAFLGIYPTITMGSLLVFWTWLSAASADIGAFFFGRMFGRTRFSNISPKKTVEGALAGFICSAGVSVFGAFLLQWPLWWITGSVYGIIIGVLGLCGDLFESCFKRDVGWKDSGSLFPGHGGMLDRADSYVLMAPLVYFFATLVLPFITRLAI